MIPEFGQFALILALCLALVQAIFPLLGIYSKQVTWAQLAKPAVLGQFTFVLIAYACLTYAFYSNDFSVVYVAENSNTHLPWIYRIAAVWGAHEGSLLLWVTMLGFWSAAVACLSKELSIELRAAILGILGWLSVGFLLFLLTTSNPFQRYLPTSPLEGIDLNPLLQDPGLATHPPMLYMGYVGFAVIFAFAMAALLTGRLDAAWARWARPWAIAAWCFLTLGITLGSWWAYRVLGWGGWWFWDPVENASLLPWLTGTALIHTLIVTEKRGQLKSWTVLLAICAFSLSLLGTFLVRSGVLVSVHAFAEDPTRGKFLLEFLALVIAGALLLYAIRAPKLSSKGYFALLSRETFLLLNNIFLIIAMSTVLLGTLYPLILDALGLGKISVGPPYFNTVFIPLMIPLLFAMGVGPLCFWHKMAGKQLWQRLLLPLSLVVILGLFLLLINSWQIPLMVVVGITLASWVIFATGQAVWLQARQRGGIQFLSQRQWGMVLAHLGMAICTIGITITTHYKIERDVQMQIGDTTIIGAYSVKFLGLNDLRGPNYTGVSGVFRMAQAGHAGTFLTPEKRIYTSEQTATTVAAIDGGVFRDLYLALGEPLPNNAWSVRIYYKPFVRWIWFGGLFMLAGGLLAIGASKKQKAFSAIVAAESALNSAKGG